MTIEKPEILTFIKGPYSCQQCERQSIIKDRGHTFESKVGK